MTSTVSNTTSKIRPILVLGASGRLGRMLQCCWPVAGELVCQSRQVNPGFVTFDPVLELERTISEMAQARAVICLAGVTPARAAQTGDVYSSNTTLALAAVVAAKAAGVGRVFLASSAAVYGATQGILLEKDTCLPVSDYGLAKLEMESAGLEKAKALGQPVTVLRIGNVAGADAILGGWRDGMTIDRLGNASTPARSYIGPMTMARAMRDLAHVDDLPDVLNFAVPGTVTMGGLLDAADLPWSPREAAEGVIPKVELSTKRLEKHIVFDPESGTAAGLVQEWRSFLARQ